MKERNESDWLNNLDRDLDEMRRLRDRFYRVYDKAKKRDPQWGKKDK